MTWILKWLTVHQTGVAITRGLLQWVLGKLCWKAHSLQVGRRPNCTESRIWQAFLFPLWSSLCSRGASFCALVWSLLSARSLYIQISYKSCRKLRAARELSTLLHSRTRQKRWTKSDQGPPSVQPNYAKIRCPTRSTKQSTPVPTAKAIWMTVGSNQPYPIEPFTW